MSNSEPPATPEAPQAPTVAIMDNNNAIKISTSMQVVGVGFIIGVLQDSCETALNSSSDVLFTATAEFAARSKEGTLDVKDMVPQNRA